MFPEEKKGNIQKVLDQNIKLLNGNIGNQKTMQKCLQNSKGKLFLRILYAAKLSIKPKDVKKKLQ